MTVRSVQLGHLVGIAAATDVTLYTCPGGHRTIVKSWHGVGVVAGSKYLWLSYAGGAHSYPMLRAHVANAVVEMDPMWVVLNAGDSIGVRSSVADGAFAMVLSGTELVL